MFLKFICKSSSLLWTIGALTTLWSVPARADVSDSFREYIDRIVPVTHEIAKKSARGKESALFVSAASSLQSRIGTASVHASQITTYLDAVPSNNEETCPKHANGLPNIREVFRRSANLLQAKNHTEQLTKQILDFENELRALRERCNNAEAFTGYDESQLGFVFRVPEAPGLIDGVYLVYAESSDEGGGNNSGVEAIPLIGSVVRFVNNIKEQKAIGEQTRRLNSLRANTQTYRASAQEACREIVKENEGILDKYVTVAKELSDFAKSIPLDALQTRASEFQSCSQNYELELTQLLKAEATKLARRKFGRAEDEARFWVTFPSWEVSLREEISAMQANKEGCRDLSAVATKLRKRVGVATLMGAEADKVINEGKQVLSAFDARCWESGL